MISRSPKSGFTLVEVLIAATILTYIATTFASVAISATRLFYATMAQCELSVRSRELRDKLLFRVRRPTSAYSYPGLLSGNISIDSASLGMTAEKIPTTDLVSDRSGLSTTFRLITTGSADATHLMDDHAPHDASNQKWRRPGGLYLGEGLSFLSQGNVIDWDALVECDPSNNRAYINLTLAAESPGWLDLGVRRERLIVPFFNKEQKKTEDIQ